MPPRERRPRRQRDPGQHHGAAQPLDLCDTLQHRASGNTTYAHDADGSMTSILAAGGSRFFQFDSANHLTCADTVPGGCALDKLHYDVDGRRVLDDAPSSQQWVAFPEDSVSLDGGLAIETRIEIRAFGERIAYKRSGDAFRTAGDLGGAPFGLPPEALGLLAGAGLLGLLAGLARRGALVLVLDRPGYAGVSAVLVGVLVLGPVPGTRVAKAGGGGGASFYWELADRLGTGLVMLDETGARKVHRTYSPFGVEQASAGTASYLPRHFAGHPKDEDSGLLYMQARWMDPQSGTFLSVDPLVADASDPQAFNAYAYARNNPVSYVDPTGASQIDCFGNCGGMMYFSGAGGSFSVPFSAAQTGMVERVSDEVREQGGNVSFNGFSVGGLAGLTIDNAGTVPPALGGGGPQSGPPGLDAALETAGANIFDNRSVPPEIVDKIPVNDLIHFANLRVAIAEVRKLPEASSRRVELEGSKSLMRIGRALLGASLVGSLVGVLNPARTPSEIARDVPGVLKGLDEKAGSEGAQYFREGLAGIMSIVEQPIGPPIR